MSDHGSLAHLPAAYFRLVPELAELDPPVERRADCSSCPMVARPDEPHPPVRMVFHPTLRCCTYNPALYNFLVGRILRRGGLGATKVRERMANRDGVTPWALRPPMAFFDRVAETPKGGFGTDAARKCPYWADEGLGCSIWQDRNAVCRAWFCQHEHGLKGRQFWHATRDLLRALQVKLCHWLADEVPHPEPDAPLDQWCVYYIATADRLDAATDAELDGLQDEGIADARAHLTRMRARLDADALPERLGAAVTRFVPLDDGRVLLEGYSHYSPTTWDKRIFLLFSVMDGTRSWREALDHVEAETGERVFDEADIRELVRVGVLEARVPEDLELGVKLRGVPADQVSGTDQEMVVFDLSDLG